MGYSKWQNVGETPSAASLPPPRVRVAFKWRLGEESRGLTASASFIASRLTVVSFPLFEVQIGWASKSQSQHILSGKVKIKPHSCLKAD